MLVLTYWLHIGYPLQPSIFYTAEKVWACFCFKHIRMCIYQKAPRMFSLGRRKKKKKCEQWRRLDYFTGWVVAAGAGCIVGRARDDQLLPALPVQRCRKLNERLFAPSVQCLHYYNGFCGNNMSMGPI